MSSSDGSFSIGSAVWPGLSKLCEECGELTQVIGKLMGTHGLVEHWDGTNLGDRLHEEMADVMAALLFVGEVNGMDQDRLMARTQEKVLRFKQWHETGDPLEELRA